MIRYSDAEYDGRACVVDECEATDGGSGTHHVITADGNTRVRTGDYVIHGLVRTPPHMRGYHSETVAKVVRGKNGKPLDAKLALGDPDTETVEESSDLLDDESSDYVD
jgi:hypothetical protein